MGRYIIRRLLIAIPTLLVISFVVYAILALAPAIRSANSARTPACRRRSARASASPSVSTSRGRSGT